MTYTGTERVDAFFKHHGIKGQRWGIRRFQNEDGSLTEAGRKRYNKIIEKYKDEKTGKFSTRKSTKIDLGIRTGYAAGATGAALVGALSNPVGLGVLLGTGAAVSAKSIVGAVKRERARKFLENTGTGDNETINADRRYATSVDPFFSVVPLGDVIKLSYGTHREKVAADVKRRLEKTSMAEAKEQNDKTRQKAQTKNTKFTSMSEVIDNGDNAVKEKYGVNSWEIDVYKKPGLHPFVNNSISINKRKEKRNKLFNEEVENYKNNMEKAIEQVKGKVTDPAYKKLLTLEPELINVKAAAQKIANAKTPEEESKLYMDMWNKMDKQKEKIINKINEDAKKDKKNAFVYELLTDRVESAGDTDPFIDRLNYEVSQAKKEKPLSHSGIKGMHWYQRRFQNPDGSLTPEGRKRYLKGGEKQIKKLEKERARKEAILSDRRKLYKHRNEFTTDEINKAMEKFAAQDKLKAQMEEGKQARLQAKADANKMKLELKRIKAQTKLEKIKSEEKEKQEKLSTQQQKLTTEGKQQTADTANKAEQWKNRVNKAKSIWEFAQVGQSILSDMGITSKDGSDSLLGALAESMGIKDTSAKKAEAAAKKAREIEKEMTGLKKAKADMAKVIVDTYGSGQTKLSKAEVDAILEGLGLISRSP